MSAAVSPSSARRDVEFDAAGVNADGVSRVRAEGGP